MKSINYGIRILLVWGGTAGFVFGSAQRRPNVLWIMSDEFRKEHQPAIEMLSEKLRREVPHR